MSSITTHYWATHTTINCLWATALGLLLYEGTAPSSHELFQHSSHSGTLQQSCRVRQWETQATVYPWLSPTSNAWVKCLAAVLFDLRTFQLLIPFPQWKWNVFLPEKEMKDTLALCCWLCSCTRSPFSLINALGPLCVLLHINPTLFYPEKICFYFALCRSPLSRPFSMFQN